MTSNQDGRTVQVVATRVSADGVDHNLATPTRVRIPVPEHCKGYVIPTDFNQFLTNLIPNILIKATTALSNPHYGIPDVDAAAHDVLSNFTVYMLCRANDGELHWRRYRAEGSNQNIPYYKWLLAHVQHFVQDYVRKRKQSRETISLSETGFDETVGNQANHAMSLDTLITSDAVVMANTAPQPMDVHSLIDLDSFRGILADLAQKPEASRFELAAIRLFDALVHELTSREIATELNISTSAVSNWFDRFIELRKFFVAHGATHTRQTLGIS